MFRKIISNSKTCATKSLSTARLLSMAHTTFPTNLPRPVDDGACDHLGGAVVPSVRLRSTSDPEQLVDVSKLQRLTIIFCYPRTGAPDETIPPEWDAIPGARGCTPQACSFRDNLPELKQRGVQNLFGLSTQGSDYQQEVRERLHLPYNLLSDERHEFLSALNLPFFEYKSQKLIKRLSIAVQNGVVIKHWYPVFPPDSNVNDILEWLNSQQ